MSTSKSQLTRPESLKKKKKGNLKSKETKKKSQQDGGGRRCAHDTMKFHTTWVGDPQLENNYITEFPLKESEFWAPHQAPQTKGPASGGRAPEHLALKAADLDYRDSTGLGKTETPLLEGTHKVSHALGPRAKAVTRNLHQTCLLVSEAVLGEVEGICSSPWGCEHWWQWQRYQECYLQELLLKVDILLRS